LVLLGGIQGGGGILWHVGWSVAPFLASRQISMHIPIQRLASGPYLSCIFTLRLSCCCLAHYTIFTREFTPPRQASCDARGTSIAPLSSAASGAKHGQEEEGKEVGAFRAVCASVRAGGVGKLEDSLEA